MIRVECKACGTPNEVPDGAEAACRACGGRLRATDRRVTTVPRAGAGTPLRFWDFARLFVWLGLVLGAFLEGLRPGGVFVWFALAYAADAVCRLLARESGGH
jgi:uncharacterized paraquat-inducible protein A